ncbi:MAG: bifunctional 5,10-methylenetetrahydrofolate dehydrogenase/5,10-methenyltetrahydrofolate cyclohydrolase [Ilumatobacteraceae bacterium]
MTNDARTPNGASRTPGGALILDGVTLRDRMISDMKREVTALSSAPCLATVLIGDDRPSQVYVRNKHKYAQLAGMTSRNETLPANASQQQAEALVRSLAQDSSVSGILVQQPVPSHLDGEALLALIPPDKDVDGLTTASMGALMRGTDALVPCTPLGVLRLLQHYGAAIAGKRAVVIGRSSLVGLPLSVLLSRKGIDATVTVAHSRTTDLVDVCREADILVSATGQARSIRRDHVKPGAWVVDVGITLADGGIVGDVAFDEVQSVAAAITPMPGGTGPMTVACLIENTLAAWRLQHAR